MTAANTKTGADFLSGGGEMGDLIRGSDWTATPLGRIESWPQSLKTAISLILSSRHPMWIGWGPEMTFLYNDAYLHVLGATKHPHSLGKPAREVWREIWDICGPLANAVFDRGEATFLDDVRLFMDRGACLEETFYSFFTAQFETNAAGCWGYSALLRMSPLRYSTRGASRRFPNWPRTR